MSQKSLKKNLVVGVTGQLSTGKSTVAALLAEYGAAVINADLLAHRSLRRGGACFKKVLKVFGNEILTKGEIDRKKLAGIVFSKTQQLKKLEKIIHPFVASETRKQISQIKKSGPRMIVLDVPLLFESGMDRLAELTIVVKAAKKLQMERCLRQGKLTKLEALKRINSQWSMAEKVRRADIIVDNGGTIEQTKKHIKKIWEVLQRRYYF